MITDQTTVAIDGHTFLPDSAARDLERLAYEYETTASFTLDAVSAGIFLRHVAHGLRMCARTLDRLSAPLDPSSAPSETPDVEQRKRDISETLMWFFAQDGDLNRARDRVARLLDERVRLAAELEETRRILALDNSLAAMREVPDA